MTQAQNNLFPYITVAETSVPANPSAGNQRLYIDPADHKLKAVNSSGTITTVDASAVTAMLTTFALLGDITPSQITADQDDYNPTGLSTASVMRLSSDASRNINGLSGGSDGRILIVHNVGSNSIVLKDEATSSTAANRFALVADITLEADAVCVLQYDSTSTRWRAVSGGGGGGGTTLQSNASKVLIAETLPSGTGTVTFSSIPATYDSLEIEIVGRSTKVGTDDTITLVLNNDSTATNYRRSAIVGYAANTLVMAGVDDNFVGYVAGASSPANSPGILKIRIPGYKETTFNKMVQSEGAVREDTSSVQELVTYIGMEWENNASINRVDLVLATGNYVTGTVIRLYGIKASPVPATTTLLNSRKLISSALPSGTGTVTFSSIPSTYKDLEIEILGRSTKAAVEDDMAVFFNNDNTAANYRTTNCYAFGTNTVGGVGADSFSFLSLAAASSPSASAALIRLNIPYYKDTTFNKQMQAVTSARLDATSIHEVSKLTGMEWENTAAINRIDLVLASGNFVAGTQIRLYGVYEADGAELSVQTVAGPLACTVVTGGDYSGLTSTASADLDATNAKVTFTAPANGKVLVRLTAGCHPGVVAANDILWMGLREGSSDIGGYIMVARGWQAAATIDAVSASVVFVRTGLTPGAAYTYKWAYKVSTSASAVIYATALTPAVMEVWPLP